VSGLGRLRPRRLKRSDRPPTTRRGTIAKIEITHPDKVLFPRDGYTKADMIAYYRAVARVMLPYTRKHPLAMLRFNQGIDGERFFHKQAPKHFPDFIERVEVPKAKGTTVYPVCNNVEALLYIANHNCIEYHLLPVLTDDLRHPDRMVFDLDPSSEDFGEVKDAARWLRELLDEVGLPSFVMTSGSRGLHIWVPLDGTSNVDEVTQFAQRTASALASRHPDTLTTEFSKDDRGSRIYIDVGRNAPAQHAVAPYSLRAKDGAPVATPIEWDELDDSHLTPRRYTLANVPQRVAELGDAWKGIRRRAHSLATVTPL
jgi:bifunctional non-homologous end joining protein LigD